MEKRRRNDTFWKKKNFTKIDFSIWFALTCKRESHKVNFDFMSTLRFYILDMRHSKQPLQLGNIKSKDDFELHFPCANANRILFWCASIHPPMRRGRGMFYSRQKKSAGSSTLTHTLAYCLMLCASIRSVSPKGVISAVNHILLTHRHPSER